MTALRISREKGGRPAYSVLVPHLACPATLAERASTCRCKAPIPSVGGAGAAGSRARHHGDCAALPPARSPSPRTGGVWV
ncbi:hypothetical protein LIER_09241 [Lithospermum erythrorhizon]|uniref:Uncharacterized protein n=1 Tax=Lithospermum erythrorhizon TaxID=34254 RepID=A0AAV3PEU7_LITER